MLKHLLTLIKIFLSIVIVQLFFVKHAHASGIGGLEILGMPFPMLGIVFIVSAIMMMVHSIVSMKRIDKTMKEKGDDESLKQVKDFFNNTKSFSVLIFICGIVLLSIIPDITQYIMIPSSILAGFFTLLIKIMMDRYKSDKKSGILKFISIFLALSIFAVLFFSFLFLFAEIG